MACLGGGSIGISPPVSGYAETVGEGSYSQGERHGEGAGGENPVPQAGRGVL